MSRQVRLDVRRAARAFARAFFPAVQQSVFHNWFRDIRSAVSSSLASQRATLRPLSPPKGVTTSRGQPAESSRDLNISCQKSRVKNVQRTITVSYTLSAMIVTRGFI